MGEPFPCCRILESLDRGEMGTVFLAKDTQFKRNFAIQFLSC